MSSLQSQACCSVPPAQAKDYKIKGKYIEVDGTKVYATGPSTATSAILVVYDIFGFSPQILQGADILAHADQSHQYQVFMPDFFHGKPLPQSSYPPDTEAKQKEVGDFFSGPAAPPKNKAAVESIVAALKKTEHAAGVKKWGSLGYCWGGKIVSLTAQEGTAFSAAAEVHPAMVDAGDAAKVTIPMCMLASGDEDAEQVKAFGEALKGDKHVETFGDQVHGWMAARADLENERVKEQYEKAYQTLLTWYHKHL